MITINEPNVKTNIIYFTSKCNLACTYCYEHLKDATKHTMSRDDLMVAANKTFAREPEDQQTFFILFGGEATLQWEDVKFFMNYARSKKDNVQFNLISNGIKFLDNDFTRDFINNKHYKDGKLALDISFDGMKGNIDRIYHSGKSSSEDMLTILSKLKVINVQYRLRYTIHQKNLDHFVDDILKIIQHFSPFRVILGEVNEQFNEADIEVLKQGKEELIQLWNSQKLKTPVCELFCDNCNGCEIHRSELSLYIDKKEINKPLVSIGLFDDFEYKIK